MRTPILTPPSTRTLAARTPPSNARSFLALIWRRRLVALLALLAVAASVAVGLALVERQYTATARISVTPSTDTGDSPVNYENTLGTVAAVAASRPVLEDVSAVVPERSVQQLRARVDAAVVPFTTLVQVSVTDPDPEVAAQVANAVADLLAEHDPGAEPLVFVTTEPAAVPTSFSSPNLPVTLLAGVLLALGAAVAVAAVVDRVARTVETADEVAELTTAPVLGVVGRPRPGDDLPALDPTRPEFGPLRALRVALQFATSDHPTRSMVVAPAGGADPNPGWLEANLAVSLGEVGHRVLLVDGSRSGRRRHPVLGAGEDPGLYDVLAGTVTLGEAVRPGPVAGVDVLELGNADLAAPSLLEMRFRDLLAAAEQLAYDVVVVHADPLTESEDARVMSIDGVLLLTVPAGRVRPTVLQRAVTHLEETRIRVLGSVLVAGRA